MQSRAAAPSNPGLVRFLTWLERNYGKVMDLIKPRPVITTKTLQLHDLQQLFSHKACAIHVEGFYPRKASRDLAYHFINQPSQDWMVASGRGLEVSDVRTIGVMPYNMVAASGDPKKVERYFDEALVSMRAMREVALTEDSTGPPSPPLLSPMDKLRLELDEVWPDGATVTKNAQGQAFAAGLARVMNGPTSLEGFCHVDDLSPLRQEEGLFSANIYLKMPIAGGDLEIWPIEIRNRWDFYRHAITLSNLTVQDDEGQMRLREAFPPPEIITPKPGDLVLLCTQRPHAVRGFPVGTRVSVQSFLTYKKGKAISLDA